MVRSNSYWGRPEAEDWRFRVRGKNLDGVMVTLGKYDKKREARERYDELVEAGYYSNLRVQSLKHTPAHG